MALNIDEADAPTVVVVDDVTKSFGGVHAVRGVSLTVRGGEVHALVGHNGAGKSTVVKLITGALRPDGGAVVIGGRRLDPTPNSALELGVRCIYQQRTLFPNCTVAENVAMLDRPRVWYSSRRSQAIARGRLARLGSELDVDRLAGTLSVGEAQEVDIARALDDSCRLLILDEPTSSLSAGEVDRLLAVMEQARSLGVGLLFISHDLDVVEHIADRITVLRDGAVAAAGLARGTSKREIVAAMLGDDPEVDAHRADSRREDGSVTRSGPLVKLKRLRGGRLHACSLVFCGGEVTGVTGGLGSGIEDLARLLGGAARPAAGTIDLGSGEVALRSPRHALRAGVTYICDDRDGAGLFDNMLPVEQIGLSQMMLGHQAYVSPGRESARAVAVAASVGLAERDARRPIAGLSGGNRQKVLLARCLATEPSVIVAHEPTVGVDVGARAAIHELLRQRAEAGAVVIVVSSDTSEIDEVADRAVVLRGGVVALDTYEFNEMQLVRTSLSVDSELTR